MRTQLRFCVIGYFLMHRYCKLGWFPQVHCIVTYDDCLSEMYFVLKAFANAKQSLKGVKTGE